MNLVLQTQISGQYSSTFIANKENDENLLQYMEEEGWITDGGLLRIKENAMFYEFGCDPVTMPVKVFLAQKNPNIDSERMVSCEISSQGETFYLWGVACEDGEQQSFHVPEGRYEFQAYAENLGNECFDLDDDERIPTERIDEFENHTFVLIKINDSNQS